MIEKEISEIKGEVTYARKLLISQKIEADDFREMKSAYNLRLDRSKAKLNVNNEDVNMSQLLSIPATAIHDKTPAGERKPIRRATRTITASEIALDANEVNTCPHSAAERAIGIALKRSNMPRCLS